jgi:hypothetical protein
LLTAFKMLVGILKVLVRVAAFLAEEVVGRQAGCIQTVRIRVVGLLGASLGVNFKRRFQ